MKSFSTSIWPLVLILPSILAGEVKISQQRDQVQRCNGMYSKKAWGGDTDPFILTKLLKATSEDNPDPQVSLIVFEWKDEDLVGVLAKPEDEKKTLICDDGAISGKLCEQDQRGKFILGPGANNSRNPIMTEVINLNDPKAVKYKVTHTGFYCVLSAGYSVQEWQGAVEFRNAYGELQASEIAKLPFFGALTIVYAVMAIFWAFLYVQNRHDILPVQNYITAIMVFLIVEQLMTWGFYEYKNIHGNNALAKVLMVIVSILNAGRNSFSFFLLLIVCMGYGVVKPSLGKTMVYVRFLAIAHFAFGVIYAVASLSITPENAGPLVLLVILPLAGTLTAFYVWTLNALNMTMKDLLDRKQSVKAMMYKKLWWCILGSIMVIFGFFFVNSFTFAGRGDPDFVPGHWKTRWFILDGWLNLVYLFDIGYVAYLWRPTANNRRFAMSDELAQDDEGFEVASFGGSLDDEEDGRPTPPSSGQHHRNGSSTMRSDLSPVPPKPMSDGPPTSQSAAAPQRHRPSEDGETIFAVGEDGERWSESEDEEERKGLTKGGKDE